MCSDVTKFSICTSTRRHVVGQTMLVMWSKIDWPRTTMKDVVTG